MLDLVADKDAVGVWVAGDFAKEFVVEGVDWMPRRFLTAFAALMYLSLRNLDWEALELPM